MYQLAGCVIYFLLDIDKMLVLYMPPAGLDTCNYLAQIDMHSPCWCIGQIGARHAEPSLQDRICEARRYLKAIASNVEVPGQFR